MRFLFAGLAFLLVACSSTATVPDSGPDGRGLTDGGSDGGLDDGGDAGPTDAGPYCPSGYAFIPYLTATATTHTFAAATQVLDSQQQYVAVVETDVGRVVWSLDATVAPVASNSLAFLALHHYFEGIAFHRVIDGFVAQGGDPNTLSANRATWGEGGPGYTFANEVSPSVNFTSAGIVAMANTGQPDSNGSQFFITFAPQPSLDQLYTIFGNVTEGSAVLPLIARGTGPMQADPPTTPTRITELYICGK
jgi:peptidylprolyl isomerase